MRGFTPYREGFRRSLLLSVVIALFCLLYTPPVWARDGKMAEFLVKLVRTTALSIHQGEIPVVTPVKIRSHLVNLMGAEMVRFPLTAAEKNLIESSLDQISHELYRAAPYLKKTDIYALLDFSSTIARSRVAERLPTDRISLSGIGSSEAVLSSMPEDPTLALLEGPAPEALPYQDGDTEEGGHLLEEGIRAFSGGDHAKGRLLLEKTVVLAPSLAGGHFYLGEVYQALGMREESIRAYEEAIRLNPRYPGAHYRLGEILAEGDESPRERAVDMLKEALRMDPDHIEAYLLLGKIAVQLGREKEAMEALQEVEIRRPKSAEALYEAALIYSDMTPPRSPQEVMLFGDPRLVYSQKGIELFREVLALSETDPALTFLRGESYKKLADLYHSGRLYEAEAAILEEYIAGSADHHARVRLGRLYYDMGRYAEAIEALEPYVMYSSSTEACVDLALSYAKLNRFAPAIAVLEGALERTPQNTLQNNKDVFLIRAHIVEMRLQSRDVERARRDLPILRTLYDSRDIEQRLMLERIENRILLMN
ncbi:MAG: tetratricopeptide repeat protein [Deltaproteobacteria bacterium]|nr:tetratricopeptide repeat protein [Deltaproteobacteria bacterium]